MQPSSSLGFQVPDGVDRRSKLVREGGSSQDKQHRGKNGMHDPPLRPCSRAYDAFGNHIGGFRADEIRKLNPNLLERVAPMHQPDKKGDDNQKRRD